MENVAIWRVLGAVVVATPVLAWWMLRQEPSAAEPVAPATTPAVVVEEAIAPAPCPAPVRTSVEVAARDVVRHTILRRAGATDLEFEVIVNASKDMPTITGLVVDRDENPIAGAKVVALGSMPSVKTAANGRFLLRQDFASKEEGTMLHLTHDHFESLTTEQAFLWGSTDVRLVMTRAPTVELAVIGPDGAPVEEFQVRVLPEARAGAAARDYAVRSRGRHPGGRASIPGVRRGASLVFVEPHMDAYPRYGVSDFVPLIVVPGANAVMVRLPYKQPCRVHVGRADGSSIADAQVQLVVTSGREVDGTTRIQSLASLEYGFDASHAYVIQEGTADAAGHSTLRVGAGANLALIVHAPGHVPSIKNRIVFAGASPLVVTLAGRSR